MQYGYVELRYIIEWARKVPGTWTADFTKKRAKFPSSFLLTMRPMSAVLVNSDFNERKDHDVVGGSEG